MESSTQTTAPTFESVWAMMQENAQLQKENAQQQKENAQQQKETDRRMQETDRRMQETDRRMQETDRRMQETDRRMQETDRLQKETAQLQQETDRLQKENAQQMRQSRADFDRRMKKFEETMGSWSNNHGAFAEEYFYNSFEACHHTFFNEPFDEIEKNAKGFTKGFKDEYDILLLNGKSVGIVEVKFKAHKDQIPKILRKAETFRANFPTYAHHQVYLGLASLAFYPELEWECIDQGIAVVKQVGDTVIVNDAHLRVF